MPKKSSGAAASVEGFVSYSILLDLIQDTKTSADERSFLHLTTLAENLETVYILISCKYLYLQRNSKDKNSLKRFFIVILSHSIGDFDHFNYKVLISASIKM